MPIESVASKTFVERNRWQRRHDDQCAEEPCAQSERERVQRPQRSARLDSEAPRLCTRRAIQRSESAAMTARPTIAPKRSWQYGGVKRGVKSMLCAL